VDVDVDVVVIGCIVVGVIVVVDIIEDGSVNG
jgi:hypothetical protein